MALSTTTFAPQIDYSDASFVFSTNDMYIITAPTQDWGLRWVSSEIPLTDGSTDRGGEKKPRIVSVQFVFESYDPDTIQTRIALLETALKGKLVATNTWPKGHFRFYFHKSGSDELYLDKCVCLSMRVARRGDKLYKPDGAIYTVIDVQFKATDPDWKTSTPAAGSGLTVNGTLIIEVADGTNAVEVYNTTDTENKCVIKSDGRISTKDEFYELQSSVS